MNMLKTLLRPFRAVFGDCYQQEFKDAMQVQRASQTRVRDEFDKTVIMMRGYNAPQKKKK